MKGDVRERFPDPPTPARLATLRTALVATAVPLVTGVATATRPTLLARLEAIVGELRTADVDAVFPLRVGCDDLVRAWRQGRTGYAEERLVALQLVDLHVARSDEYCDRLHLLGPVRPDADQVLEA